MAQAQQYLDYMYEEVSVSLYGTNSSSDSEFIEKQMNHYENNCLWGNYPFLHPVECEAVEWCGHPCRHCLYNTGRTGS